MKKSILRLLIIWVCLGAIFATIMGFRIAPTSRWTFETFFVVYFVLVTVFLIVLGWLVRRFWQWLRSS